MRDDPTLGQVIAWSILFFATFSALSLHLYLERLNPINLKLSPAVVMLHNGMAEVTANVVIPRDSENVAFEVTWIDPSGLVTGSDSKTIPGDIAPATWAIPVRVDEAGQWEVRATLWRANKSFFTAKATLLVTE